MIRTRCTSTHDAGTIADVEAVVAYHERTKHNFNRYAPGPGHLDWATQPHPWREFQGADAVALPREDELAGVMPSVSYAQLYSGRATAALPLTKDSLSSFLYHSLALSAWKKYGDSSWSLRVNPSSGNLHPTEGYAILPPLEGLSGHPGVHHYTSRQHALERRCSFSQSTWEALLRWSGAEPAEGRDGEHSFAFFAALTSVHWREAWKYGERAFRYCNHDVGHALGALRLAAAMHGWHLRVLPNVTDEQLARMLGTDRRGDFVPHEAEEVDLLAVVTPQGRHVEPRDCGPDEAVLAGMADEGHWAGKARKLSPSHVPWPAIDRVAQATRQRAIPPLVGDHGCPSPDRAAAEGVALPREYLERVERLRASQIVRQRRSAVDFDGSTHITSGQFYGMLSRVMPSLNPVPWDALPLWQAGASGRPSPAKIHLGLFVHRVSGISPGIYLLARDPNQVERLKGLMKHENPAVEYLWQKPADAPEGLPLYLLAPGDFAGLAAKVSCLQDIAGDGCFSLGMLADFKETIEAEGAHAYRRLFWEAGLVGQVLYLEAEGQGVRGTGIGCYFDDPVHQVFGLRGLTFQSLYHFTVGGPVEDTRLRTLRAYEMTEANG